MAAPNIVQTAMDITSMIAAGVGKVLVPIAADLVDLADSTDLMTNYVPGFKGRILAIDALVTVAATTAAKLATLTTKIKRGSTTTALTGGVLSLTSANCTPKGVSVNGTAITAGNAFGASDGITISMAATAFVEGKGVVMLTLVNDDMLDAIAKSLNMLNQ